jgi:ubiquinone/menaquinone biosynthesis C-methylase UbiE
MTVGPDDRKAQARMQFNSIVADYDNGPGCFAHFGRRLVAAAGVGPGHKVLDVASGLGAVLFPAAGAVGNAGSVVGLDLADEMARATNAEAARRGLDAKVEIGDAENIGFADATFDRVLCGFGIMFFPNQERALAEFRRVLKPNGQIGISTWRVDQAYEFKPVLSDLGVDVPEPPGWITEPDELSALLTHTGFANVRIEVDAHRFRYADIDEYWRQARGTGFRRALDGLDQAAAAQVRSSLAERVRSHRRPDGLYLEASALIAVANG